MELRARSAAGRGPTDGMIDGVRPAVRRVLRHGRELLGDDEVFLPLILRLTPLGTTRRISDATELVIEGFPRSGNTFATFALNEVEGRTVNVASRVHVPSQVKRAVRLAKPTLVVVREPIGCLASLLTAAPHVHVASALKEYVHHHRQLLPFREGFVVSTFAQTTTDFGSVTRTLNQRFGTTFAELELTPGMVNRIFARIDADHLDTYGERASEHLVPRPSEQRRTDSEGLRRQLQSPLYAGLVVDARAVYEELAGHRPGA